MTSFSIYTDREDLLPTHLTFPTQDEKQALDALAVVSEHDSDAHLEEFDMATFRSRYITTTVTGFEYGQWETCESFT